MPIKLISVDQSKDSDTASSGQQPTARRLFIICEICHWCASLLNDSNKGVDIAHCPNCKIRQALSTVPIADNETFIFSYSEKHGVELDFMPRK